MASAPPSGLPNRKGRNHGSRSDITVKVDGEGVPWKSCASPVQTCLGTGGSEYTDSCGVAVRVASGGRNSFTEKPVNVLRTEPQGKWHGVYHLLK